MKRQLGMFAILTVAALAGCRAQTLEGDQADMRNSLLTLYKQQVMENLVRTARMEPVIEIDFTTVTGTITELGKGTAGYGRESDTTSKSKGTNSYLVKTTPTISGEQDITTQLTVTGNPVTDPSIYKAYEEYIWGRNGAPIDGFPAQLDRDVPESQPQHVPPTGQPVPAPSPAPGPPPPAPKVPYGVAVPLNPFWVFAVDATPPVPPTDSDPHIRQGVLLVSDQQIPEDSVAEEIQYKGKFYYIPTKSAGQFFALYKWVVLRRTAASQAQSASSSVNNVGHQLELFRLNQLNPQ